ncbi:SOS-response transcriptional repressor LexA [Rhizobium subbaraonis]|uniref:SOS-response transcriptional repressor LexA n=1 Tax=Rhizobium subbaraonis TaxID=908946 RepID=A0A285U547_9HYPH|nr:helix-turn-helix domain-containing protein [Rhizobium subbaraonis]SOC37055.1 SOS-response transcriptional repressor LexA [Rhizobium subbaraonis]
MGQKLLSRVRRRMAVLGLNNTQVDKQSGLPVGFTRDLLDGRKAQPREANLAKLAKALDCDVEYLMLEQSAPRKFGIPEDGLPLLGTCRAGVFLEAVPEQENDIRTPFEPDPRFPAEYQGVYEVRDSHAAGLGILQDSMIIVLSYPGMLAMSVSPDRQIVVIGRTKDDVTEISIAQLREDYDPVYAVRNSGDKETIIEGKWDVLGLVLTSIKSFA